MEAAFFSRSVRTHQSVTVVCSQTSCVRSVPNSRHGAGDGILCRPRQPTRSANQHRGRRESYFWICADERLEW